MAEKLTCRAYRKTRGAVYDLEGCEDAGEGSLEGTLGLFYYDSGCVTAWYILSNIAELDYSINIRASSAIHDQDRS